MTLGFFSEKLSSMADSGSEEYGDYVRGMFSKSALEGTLIRRDAARLIHLYLYMVLGEKDLDWGEYGKLKDIYECRICANAIAQVCIKGIMLPEKEDEFGVFREVGDKEAEELIRIVSKRN